MEYIHQRAGEMRVGGLFIQQYIYLELIEP